ncbi:hypothetical protein PG991_007104 [Apiospora marii]|uniref:amidase n=1 Tax=Apiospora marii TaxID=335849 RepID=A0ABR1RTN3_9PEZI
MGSTGDTAWQTRAAAKREAILGSIPGRWRLDKIPTVDEQRNVTGTYIRQFLSPKEAEITEADAVGIVEKTTSGAWSAVEVAEAFCHRASLSHQLVNCLHETFFEAALADAKELDDWFAKHGKPKGPLHGLPVSLKDQFHVRGVDTTMGYVGWIDTFQGQKGDARSKTFESEMVRELRRLGAVLYCKTAVPHTLMCGETTNNIIGCTWNPTNRHLSSGGSSGGEGALIALGGSPGGFGTDIGGSIRVPSSFNGLFGLRPTSGRLPYEGMANSMDGQNSVLSVVGPMASSAGGVRLLTQAVLSAEPWLHDPLVAEIPWRGDLEARTKDLISTSQLRVGFHAHDGAVTPHPPLQRAVALLRDIITRSGNTALDWQPPASASHPTVADLVTKTWFYDGGADVRKDFALSGEPWMPQIMDVWRERPQADATAVAETNRALRRCRKEYLDYWHGTGADVFVTPCAPFAAARPGRYHYVGYTSFVNGLDLPSVVVPITTVDKNVDVVDTSFQPVSELDRKTQSDYDPEIYDGAPVSLQIVGRRYQEEKVLAVAEWLEGELKKASPTS